MDIRNSFGEGDNKIKVRQNSFIENSWNNLNNLRDDMSQNQLQQQQVNMNPFMKNISRIESFKKKLDVSVADKKLPKNFFSCDARDKVVPSQDMHNPQEDPFEYAREPHEDLPGKLVKVNFNCPTRKRRKIKVKLDKNKDKNFRIMKSNPESLRVVSKPNKNKRLPVIKSKIKTRESSGGYRLPECFLAPNPTQEDFNGTMKHAHENPVRFVMNNKIKPKSKDSTIRLCKFKIPKRQRVLNSEAVSPLLEKDLFDVTFS